MFIELTLRYVNKTINIAVDNIALFADDTSCDSGKEKCLGGIIVFKEVHRTMIGGINQWRNGHEFLVKETADEIKKKLFDLSFSDQVVKELQK